MITKRLMKSLLAASALAVVATGSTASHAATFDVALTASATGFVEGGTDFDGFHFDQFSVFLSPATPTDLPITVAQGDTINTTVTFDGLVTIPVSEVRTDLVQFLSGDGFPATGTQVDGTYKFFNGSDLVNTFGFESTTSGGLASFAAVFPPSNGAFTFDSFTDDFVVTTLSAPATIDHSSFTYSLVSNLPAVPEPATWSLMLVGFGGLGALLRRRRAEAVAA
jgi:hypothetical protein